MDFNLDTTYGYYNDIHKSKIIKYKPNNLATMNTVNTNINIILNREENHLNLRDSYLEIEFVVSDDNGGVFANDANIRLVNYGMMALFSSIKLETSGGRIIEYIDHCHPKIIYGLGFKLILKRNNNDRALYRFNANPGAVANDGNIEIRDKSWCVPSIDPSNDNRIIVQKGLSKKNNVDFSYYERKTFYENVPNATNFLFDLGMESGMERPQYIIVGFENNNVNEQTHDASTFDVMSVTECYCKIGSEFYPEDRMNINYGTNNYNEAFKGIVSFNKDYNGLPHNSKPYINHRTFESNYRICVFDTRYQRDHIGPQPMQLNFKFSAAVADVMSCISIN